MSLLSLMFYNMWIVVITADLVVIDLDVCKKNKVKYLQFHLNVLQFLRNIIEKENSYGFH